VAVCRERRPESFGAWRALDVGRTTFGTSRCFGARTKGVPRYNGTAFVRVEASRRVSRVARSEEAP